MKIIYQFVVIFFFYGATAQDVSIYNYSIIDHNPGKYLKDINNDFTPFVGTWTWTQGGNQVSVIFKKITHKYFDSCSCYADFLAADYIYTTNYNTVTVVNTTATTQNSTDPAVYPMVAPYPRNGVLRMSYTDFVINKNYPGSYVIFTPVASNPLQKTMDIYNPDGIAIAFGEPDFDNSFILPNNIVLTKE